MNDDRSIRLDRMRYTKNSLASSLAILSIVFDVLFFISIYESNVASWYYNILMGASILYNLIFMLAAFLSSEGIKNYKISYAYVMIVLGVIQVLRIFIYPVKAHNATVMIQEQPVVVMQNGQFVWCVFLLVASAACLFAGAFIGAARSRQLKAHLESIGAAA